MALVLGSYTKSQVRLVIALFATIIIIAAWEIYPSGTSRMSQSTIRPAAARRDIPGRASAKSRFDFALRMDELSRSESVEYTGNGRNVFSKGLAPVAIEAPIAPARPSPQAVAAAEAAQEQSKRPPMELKYLGYTEGNDKVLCALIVHGDDFFMARTGDIMFHRFKVGVILPASVQVTDLSFNYSQTIAAFSN